MITVDYSVLNQFGTPMFYSDVFANRPAAGIAGRLFVSTDTKLWYRDTGSTWDLIGNPGTVTSIGLSMPSAFTVSNSPITGSGTIGVTGAGTVSQYIRGDGTLADFPSTGGGSSVSYYLNGGTNQGTFVGNTYYQMSKTANTGAAANFTISANGYITQFITDAGDPGLLNIPAGNWNVQAYFSSSANGGTPQFYVELYKYNGSAFTLIASSSANPEIITGGTSADLYYTSIAVPATTLTVTDRLAVRFYVNNDGKTITLYTQSTRLSQVITTFSTGITAINGSTSQVQFLATGTTGTDFNISTASATHTFNLPVASGTNTGKLSSTDWTTFNNKQDAITLTTIGSSGASTFISNVLNIPNYTIGGIGGVPTSRTLTINGTSYDLSADRTWNVGTVTGSGADKKISYWTSSNGLSSSNIFVWDYNNNRQGIGTTSPQYSLHIQEGTGNEADLGIETNNDLPNYFSGFRRFKSRGNSSSKTTIVNGDQISADGHYGYDGTAYRQVVNIVTKVNGAVSTNNIPTIYQISVGNTDSNLLNMISLYSSGTYQLNQFTSNGFLKTFGSNGQLTIDTTSYTPTTRILTINGTSYDLSLDRTWNVGTVTSVGLLTGTTGTDVNVSGSPVTGSGSITLNIPTASSVNRGALSSADWTTFNNKQSTVTLTTTGTSGAATFVSNTLNIPQYQGAITLTTTGSSGAATLVGNTLNIPNYGSALSGYLPLTGGTLTGALAGTSSQMSLSSTAASFIPTGATIPTNGMYLSAANTLDFATASTNAISISSTQRVGINTAPTTDTLTVKGNITTTNGGNVTASGIISSGSTISSGLNITAVDTIAGASFIPQGSTAPVTGMYTASSGELSFSTGTTKRFSIASTGAATFSSSVTAGGTIFANYGGGQIQIGGVGTGTTSGVFQGTNSNNLFIGDWNTATKGLTINVSSGASAFSSTLSVNSPSSGATGEGIVVGRSFKIDATGSGQRAVQYMVSDTLSDTYGSGLQLQGANTAGDKAFGFNLNTSGGFEIYNKSGGTFSRSQLIDATGAATFASSVTLGTYLKINATTITNTTSTPLGSVVAGGFKYFQGTLSNGQKFGDIAGTYVCGYYFMSWFDGASVRGYAIFATVQPVANGGTVLISSGGGTYTVSATYNAANAISFAFDGSNRGAILSNNTGVAITFYIYALGGI